MPMGIRTLKHLREAFSRGETPQPGELKGQYAVKLVTGYLPDIRFFGHRKFFPDDVAEENGGKGGYNEFLKWMRIGSFKTEVTDSILDDGQRVLKINYNRKGNLFLIKPLNDELKRIREGYYLGRGVFHIFGLAFNTFYFSLEKID
jgi:hypothetical protein